MWWLALCALMFIFSPKKCERMSDTETNRSDEDNSTFFSFAFCLQMSTMFPLFYLMRIFFLFFFWEILRDNLTIVLLLRRSFLFYFLFSTRYWKSWRKMRKIGKSRAQNNNRMKNINQQWGFKIFVTNEDRTNERKSKHAVLFL